MFRPQKRPISLQTCRRENRPNEILSFVSPATIDFKLTNAAKSYRSRRLVIAAPSAPIAPRASWRDRLNCSGDYRLGRMNRSEGHDHEQWRASTRAAATHLSHVSQAVAHQSPRRAAVRNRIRAGTVTYVRRRENDLLIPEWCSPSHEPFPEPAYRASPLRVLGLAHGDSLSCSLKLCLLVLTLLLRLSQITK